MRSSRDVGRLGSCCWVSLLGAICDGGPLESAAHEQRARERGNACSNQPDMLIRIADTSSAPLRYNRSVEPTTSRGALSLMDASKTGEKKRPERVLTESQTQEPSIFFASCRAQGRN